MASTESIPPKVEAEWDEARYIEALRHLEQLQEKVDELRLAIPRIIQPLRSNQPSPAHLVNAFKKSAEDTTKDLANFKLEWQSEETRTIIKKAKASYKSDHDLSAGARVQKYGWSAHSQLPDPTEKAGETQKDVEMQNAIKPDEATLDVTKILEDYKAAHPDFKISLTSENQIIKIQFKVPSMILMFVITRQQATNNKHTLEAECQGNSRLFAAITRCIASRPLPDDLNYLLDMIAAYSNTRTAVCARCGKMLDDSALTPAARRLKEDDASKESQATEWEAFHESCLV